MFLWDRNFIIGGFILKINSAPINKGKKIKKSFRIIEVIFADIFITKEVCSLNPWQFEYHYCRVTQESTESAYQCICLHFSLLQTYT
jgi:hypothetical protein